MEKKKIFYFALGPVLTGVLSSLSMPITAWLFQRDDVGRLAMLQIVCSFATLFFSLGLDQGFVREYHESKSKSSLLYVTFIPSFGALICFLILVVFFIPNLSFLMYEKNDSTLLWLTIATIIVFFVTRFFSLVTRMREDAFCYSFVQFFPKLIFLLTIFVFWKSSMAQELNSLFVAHFLGLAVTLMVLMWFIRTDLQQITKAKFDWKFLKSLLAYGFPLIWGGAAFWGLSAISRVLLKSYGNYSELGLYSVALGIASAASLLQGVFSIIWAPTVYKWAARGENLDIIDSVTEYCIFFVVMVFSFFGLFSWVLPYFLPPEYYDVQFLLVACLGQPLLYALSEVTVVGINLAKKTVYAMLAPVIAVFVNYFFCVYLIPRFGGRGAAYSTFIAFVVFFVARTEGSSYVWRNFPRRKMYFFVSLIVLATSFSVFCAPKYFYFNLVLWVIFMFFSVFSFRHIIFSLMKNISSLLKDFPCYFKKSVS